MYEQVEKPKKNKSRAIANSVGQKKSNVKQAVDFMDNRQDTNTILQAKNTSQNKAVTVFQLRTHHYWYRVGRHDPWQYAGGFGNHTTANDWLKSNRAALGITKFGEGNSAESYK